MGMRALGAAVVLALLGVAGGFAAAHLLREGPLTMAEAAPVPASSPSIPVDPVRDFAPDIGYPPLLPSLSYRRHTVGDVPFEWVYAAPKGWVSTEEALDEIRWRPADEPTVGGFSLRVKLSNEHKSKEAMVAQKLAAMQSGYEDVEILGPDPGPAVVQLPRPDDRPEALQHLPLVRHRRGDRGEVRDVGRRARGRPGRAGGPDGAGLPEHQQDPVSAVPSSRAT